MKTCGEARTVSGMTITCGKRAGHYTPKNAHRSGWIKLGFVERMVVNASKIRVEWFEA